LPPEALTDLSADERGRAAGLPDPVRRRRWEVGRVSLRRLLGDYLDRSPASLAFAYAGRGKPVLADAAGLHFNLAHAGRHALVAIARHRPVGVDLELARPLADVAGLARSLLPPSVAAGLARLPPAVRGARLLRCWTRLEALGKLAGTGIAGGLAVLARPEGTSLTSPDLRRGVCGDMWLEDVDAGPGMVAAVAVGGAAAVDLAWGEPNARSASLR
jgi:4'-phosphopantetheinyl transferase